MNRKKGNLKNENDTEQNKEDNSIVYVHREI